MDSDLLTVLLSSLAVTTLIALARSARVVNKYEKGLALRLGKYRRTVDPGFTFLFPVIEDMIKVDMRERLIRIEPINLLTKDAATVTMDAAIYYRIVDAVKSHFEIQSLPLAVTEISRSTLRSMVGSTIEDEVRTELPSFSTKLQSVLEDHMSAWGAEVTKVEIQRVPLAEEGRAGEEALSKART